MEMKTKKQYTYFIYPYIVEEKKYEKHLYKLLTNRKCKIKQFNREEERQINNFFLPKVRDYMFWYIGLNKTKIKKLNEFDTKMQSTLLNKYPCTIFEYDLENDIQGKVGPKDGIFFRIKNVEIVCFKPGICFMLIKTMLDEKATLQNLCEFNAAFRDIQSLKINDEQFENINIQSGEFQDIKGIQSFIKDITGNNKGARELNIDTDRFITYSFASIDKEDWEQEAVDNEFKQYANITVTNDAENLREVKKLELDKDIKFGFVKNGTVLLTCDSDEEPSKMLKEKYENEYLYCYIYELYRNIYLKKLNQEFKLGYQFEKTKTKFVEFTQNLMIEEITNNGVGVELIENWEDITNIKEVFFQTKQKYDLLYKNVNIEKTAKSNRIIAIILAILVIINIINSLNLFS